MHPLSNTAQMTEWMRQQFAQDLRVAQFGTLTDMHLFGGRMDGGMMGSGRMGGRNGRNGYHGMMNGNGTVGGGRMGGWNNFDMDALGFEQTITSTRLSADELRNNFDMDALGFELWLER